MLFIRMWIPPGASVFAHVLHMKINYRHIFFSGRSLYIFLPAGNSVVRHDNSSVQCFDRGQVTLFPKRYHTVNNISL